MQLDYVRQRLNECGYKSIVNAGTFGSFNRPALRRPQPKPSLSVCLIRLKIPLLITEACMNHIAGEAMAGSKKHYNFAEYLDEKIEAMDKWGTFIDGVVRPKPKLHAVTKTTGARAIAGMARRRSFCFQELQAGRA
jgi:hypothetical protein